MSTEHSPLPWKWTPCETEGGELVSGAQLVRCDGKPVWSVDCGDYMGLSDADAEFIVRACNNHERLLTALKIITPPMPPHDAICHVGICPQSQCAYCGRIKLAHDAIAEAEKETT